MRIIQYAESAEKRNKIINTEIRESLLLHRDHLLADLPELLLVRLHVCPAGRPLLLAVGVVLAGVLCDRLLRA